MTNDNRSFVITGGHVMDDATGTNQITDVHVRNGKIEFVGRRDIGPDVEKIDAKGCYVSAGWVDIHVHAYGTLGFSNPDSIGVYQGVTSLSLIHI